MGLSVGLRDRCRLLNVGGLVRRLVRLDYVVFGWFRLSERLDRIERRHPTWERRLIYRPTWVRETAGVSLGFVSALAAPARPQRAGPRRSTVDLADSSPEPVYSSLPDP